MLIEERILWFDMKWKSLIAYWSIGHRKGSIEAKKLVYICDPVTVARRQSKR